MMKSANHSLVRYTNQKAILDAIYDRGPISRAELARALSISKPAAADNLNQLIELGVVRELGTTQALKGGRKPILVGLNKEYRYMIAIDLNFNDPVFAISNLAGEVLDDLTIKVATQATFEMRYTLMENAINLLLNANSLAQDKLFQIGISSPGIFGEESSLYELHVKFSKWFEGDIASRLAERFGVPVFIKNDANTGAMGELLYGTGRGMRDLLYLCCGNGLGAGIILGGQLFEGSHFDAGNLSNYTDMRRMSQRRTIEEEVCIPGILDKAAEAIDSGADSWLATIPREQWALEHIREAYHRQDALVCGLLRCAAEEIACVAVGISSCLGIRDIVFGGEYLSFSDLILPVMERVFTDCTGGEYRLHRSELGMHAGLHGVFGISRSHFIEKICSLPPKGQ